MPRLLRNVIAIVVGFIVGSAVNLALVTVVCHTRSHRDDALKINPLVLRRLGEKRRVVSKDYRSRRSAAALSRRSLDPQPLPVPP